MDYLTELENELVLVEADQHRSMDVVKNFYENYITGLDDIVINDFIYKNVEYTTVFNMLMDVPPEKVDETLAMINKIIEG